MDRQDAERVNAGGSKGVDVYTVPIGARNTVVLPPKVRSVLGVRPGDSLVFLVSGGIILLRSRPVDPEACVRPSWVAREEREV